jgi:PAS domain S-box-containing protein
VDLGLDFLAAVLERVGAAIVACDEEGKVVIRNAAARAILGQEALPSHHLLFRALREGSLQEVEVPTGLLITAEPLFDGDQKRVGAVAHYTPLQVRGDQEARKRLELLLESTGEGICGLDLEGRCTFVNGSAAAMLGFSPEDLRNVRLHDLIHHTKSNGQPYPAENCPIYRAFREGVGCRVDDECFFRSDGSSFPVEYSSYPILDKGEVCGAVVTFSDVSARRRTEAALRASEAKYRSLFETISEGVYQTSSNGELLAANRALIEMLGYGSETELRAQDVKDLYLNPEDRKRLTAQLERDGQLIGAEFLLKRKDGRVIRVIENARAIQDERKGLIYYEGTLTLK